MKIIRKDAVSNKVVVDVCTGSGVIGVYVGLKMNPSKVILIDVDHRASCNAYKNVLEKKLGIKTIVITCDLLSCIRDRSVDVITANPPYLPALRDKVIYPDVEAKLMGLELISRLIKQSSIKLRKHGVLYLVFSSLTNVDKVIRLLRENKFVLKNKVDEHYFFEDIIALEAVLNE